MSEFFKSIPVIPYEGAQAAILWHLSFMMPNVSCWVSR